jgi:uncharacterized protein YggE
VGCAHDTVEVQIPAERRGLIVTGSGSVKSVPDLAVVRIGVESRDPDVKVAADKNGKQTSLVIANLKALGIAAADLQTSDFSVRYEEHPPTPPVPVGIELAGEQGAERVTPKGAEKGAEKSTEKGAEKSTVGQAPVPPPKGHFVVNNTLHVRVRDLDKLGDVLSTSVSLGANSIWGVEFELDDPKPLQATARDVAVADALAKAKRLAEAAGAQLGPLLRINEGGTPATPASDGMYRMASVKLQAPTEAGSVEVTATVTLEFALAAPSQGGAHAAPPPQ